MIIGGIDIRPVMQRLEDRYYDYWVANDKGCSTPWCTWFSGFDNSITDTLPGMSELRARALMKVLGRLGFVGGCHCGCRGDYEITDKGREWLAKSA